jgi:hypothetical protein
MTKKEKWFLAGAIIPWVAMPVLLLLWATFGVLLNTAGTADGSASILQTIVASLFSLGMFAVVLLMMASPAPLVLFFLKRGKRVNPRPPQYQYPPQAPQQYQPQYPPQQPPQPPAYPSVPPTDLPPS